MAVIVVKPLKQSDVAYLLRSALGPACAWEDMLADMRRGKNDFHGVTLLPCGRTAGRIPLYLRDDVDQFVREAARVAPAMPNPTTALSPTSWVEMDTTLDRRLWRTRVLKPTLLPLPPVAT